VDKSKLNEWLQLVASVGVILSLIFVGLEIQQSREIAMADIYQQRAAMVIDVQLGTLLWDDIHAAMRKSIHGEPLSEEEDIQLGLFQLPWFSYWENNHYQYQIGLLSEEQWLSSRNAMLNQFTLAPRYREWWIENRDEWRQSFAREVDQVLAEAEARLDSN